MNTTRVVFRADGNASMGMGHVTRSLALADILSDAFSCSFFSHDPSGALAGIKGSRCEINKLRDALDINEFLSVLQPSDIVVLDGYHFDTDYQLAVRELGCGLVCIDDTQELYYAADAVINHHVNAASRQFKTAPGTRLYLGPSYALLRKPFLDQISQPRTIGAIKTALVLFGGSDFHNLTSKYLDIIARLPRLKEIILITGKAYTARESLTQRIVQFPEKKITHYHDMGPEELVSLIIRSQVAVCPASTVLTEMFTVGIPVITGWYVENQRAISDYLEQKDFVHCIGDMRGEKSEAVAGILASLSVEKANRCAREQKNLFGGSPEVNLQNIFRRIDISRNLSLRKAIPQDAGLYFDWANDPEVRQNSFHSGTIAWEDHLKWFSRRIENPDTQLLLLEYQGKPVAQVRMEKSGDMYTVNYSVDRNYRGLGTGEAALARAIEHCRGLANNSACTIRALVKKDNIASSKVFLNLGFEEVEGPDENTSEYHLCFRP